MTEVLNVRDNVTLTSVNVLTGEVKKTKVHNLITKPGEFFLIDALNARANVIPAYTGSVYLAVGTGSVASNYWLGSLTTEVSGIGNPGREKPDSISRSNQTVLISTYFDTTAASGALTEAGLFVTGYDSGGTLRPIGPEVGSGILLSYATFNEVTKDDTNTLTIDWEFNF